MAKVTGGADLDRKLRQLAGIPRGKITPVLRRGANVIAKEERALIPVASGKTRKSITVTVSPGFDVPELDGAISIFVGPRKGAGSKAHLIEWGNINTAAHPFAQPAVDTRGQEALGIILTGLAKVVSDNAK